MGLKYEEITSDIIGAAFEVYNLSLLPTSRTLNIFVIIFKLPLVITYVRA
jgi:hypothetical protein